MPNFKDILTLCRVSNLPTVWTNVLAAIVLSGAEVRLFDLLMLGLALSCFYSAGMCLNDLADAEIDRIEKPQRPIPAGRISKSAALGLVVALLGLPLALLALLYPQALVAGLLLTGLIILYDLKHKSSAFSVYVMASCRLLVFLLTGLAVAGSLASMVVVAGILQFAYIVLLSIVARHENMREKPFAYPVIPRMLAGISLLDGLMMAVIVHPLWLLAGICGAALTHLGQRYVRGD